MKLKFPLQREIDEFCQLPKPADIKVTECEEQSLLRRNFGDRFRFGHLYLMLGYQNLAEVGKGEIGERKK